MIAAAGLALAMAQADPPASEVLADNRLVIALWQDAGMKAIFAPYFDCYWNEVQVKPDSALRDQTSAAKMFGDAYRNCSLSREHAEDEASKYLMSRSDYSTNAVRSGVIARYRQQVGTITLIQHYHDSGKADFINGYLSQVGKTSTTLSHARN